MISFPLLKRNMIQALKPLVIFIVVLSLYTGVIVYMYDPELIKMLNDYQEALPQMMSIVGMTGIATSLVEFIKIYLYGFLMLLFPLIFIIILGNEMVMHYVDSGSMACLLVSPNSRLKIIVTQAVSIILNVMLLMIIMTGIGICCCEIMFPGELDISKYVMLNVATMFLQLAVAGIIFFAACYFNQAKFYYSIGAGIPLLFFLINMLSNMGDKLEKLKYVTIYTLLPIDKIVSGDGGIAIYITSMIVIAMALFGCGIIKFVKKDLPL